MSITVSESRFRLDTADTTYLFQKTAFGHLESLHYGRKIPEGDVESLRYKHEIPFGSAVLYDESKDASYCLDELPLEWSGVGKGDFRTSPIEIRMPDGSFTCDFV